MSSTVVYKQSFKSRTLESTAGLNVAHLQYISTRPGVVKNPECGFGLWGRLDAQESWKIQTDLQMAKKIIREASHDHTLYRGLVSVGKEDAENFDLYNRKTWEGLVERHINDIAREMDIQPENLRWCASMHMKKTHPHVHLIFWDASSQPRSEYIPPQQFQQKMERIRAAFAGDIHREEIRELQKAQRDDTKEMRKLLQSMVLEANPIKGMDLDRFEGTDIQKELARELMILFERMPTHGSVKFQYLPESYKLQVQHFVHRCMQEVPEIASEVARYEAETKRVSELYANDDATAERTLADAVGKLEKELGNQVMRTLLQMAQELRMSGTPENAERDAFIKEIVHEVMMHPNYQKFIEEKYYCRGLDDTSWRESFPQMMQWAVWRNNRIQFRMQGYAVRAAGIDLDRAPRCGKQTDGESKQYTLGGRRLTEEQWNAYSEALKQVQSEVNRELRKLCGLSGNAENDQYADDSAIPPDVRERIIRTLKDEHYYQVDFKQLVGLLTMERIPIDAMSEQIEDWSPQMEKVVEKLLSDYEIDQALKQFALDKAGIDLRKLPDATDADTGHILFGKVVSDKMWEAYMDARWEQRAELWKILTVCARAEAGWTVEHAQATTSGLLMGMLRIVSQATNQRSAAHAKLRHNRDKRHSRDKSKEQRRDERAQAQLGSDMEWY